MKGLEPSTFCMASRRGHADGSSSRNLRRLKSASDGRFTALWSAAWSAGQRTKLREETWSAVRNRQYARVMPRGYGREVDPVSTAFLLVEKLRSDGMPVWTVKWRSANDERVRRRLGFAAWVEPDGAGGWKPRPGRPHEGALTEFQARRRMAEFVRSVEAELAAERGARRRGLRRRRRAVPRARARVARARAGRRQREAVDDPRLRVVAGRARHAVRAAGSGKRIGRVMAAIGDLPVDEITAAHIEAILVAHSREGVGARSVNKHRQVLAAIFNYALRPENAERWQLTVNPASATVKRKEPGRSARGLHGRADRGDGASRRVRRVARPADGDARERAGPRRRGRSSSAS